MTAQISHPEGMVWESQPAPTRQRGGEAAGWMAKLQKTLSATLNVLLSKPFGTRRDSPRSAELCSPRTNDNSIEYENRCAEYEYEDDVVHPHIPQG